MAVRKYCTPWIRFTSVAHLIQFESAFCLAGVCLHQDEPLMTCGSLELLVGPGSSLASSPLSCLPRASPGSFGVARERHRERESEREKNDKTQSRIVYHLFNAITPLHRWKCAQLGIMILAKHDLGCLLRPDEGNSVLFVTW